MIGGVRRHCLVVSTFYLCGESQQLVRNFRMWTKISTRRDEKRESRLPRNHVTLLMVVAVETFVVKFSVISQTLSVFLPSQRSLWRYLKLDFIPELPTAELMMLMRFFNSRGSHWKNEGILKTLQSFSPPHFSLILSKKTFN